MNLKTAVLFTLCWASSLVWAQETVLKNEQVTESALADTLAGKEPASQGLRTRGFRPVAPAASASGSKRAGLLIVFATDSAELMLQSRGTLDVLGRALQSDRLALLSFNVEGHADPRGSADRNLRLSELRAESVVNYLVKQHGIAKERLTPLGKGSSEPINKERADAAENRRVTIATRSN